MSNRRDEPRWIPIAVTAVYLVVALIGISHHEPWRDELQAWMVVVDADSYLGVHDNMRYEGNPMLWQSLLYPLTRMSHDPIWMQGLHALIAAAFVWVFNRFAPFPILWRVLFSFGYFTLFEYGLISRGYGLGLLLALLACALLRGARPRPVLLGVVLFLLANTSLYGMVIAAGLAGVALLEHRQLRRQGSEVPVRPVAIGLGVALAGVLLSAWQIYPEPNNTFFVPYPQGIFDPARFQLVASKIAAAHFPIPSLSAHWWNTNLFLGDEGLLNWLLPAAVLATGAAILLRRPLLLLFYLGANAILLFLSYLTLLADARYHGHFLIVLIVSLWLAAGPVQRDWGPPWLRRVAAGGARLERPFLVLVLSANLAGGALAYGRDLVEPFTVSGEAARFLAAGPHAGLPVVGTRDYQVSPLAALLDRPLFYPEHMRWGSYMIWDELRRDLVGGDEVSSAVRAVLPSGGGRCILALSFPAAGEPGGAVPADLLGPDLRLQLLGVFPAGVVVDEQFFLYLVEKTVGVAHLEAPTDSGPPREPIAPPPQQYG